MTRGFPDSSRPHMRTSCALHWPTKKPIGAGVTNCGYCLLCYWRALVAACPGRVPSWRAYGFAPKSPLISSHAGTPQRRRSRSRCSALRSRVGRHPPTQRALHHALVDGQSGAYLTTADATGSLHATVSERLRYLTLPNTAALPSHLPDGISPRDAFVHGIRAYPCRSRGPQPIPRSGWRRPRSQRDPSCRRGLCICCLAQVSGGGALYVRRTLQRRRDNPAQAQDTRYTIAQAYAPTTLAPIPTPEVEYYAT